MGVSSWGLSRKRSSERSMAFTRCTASNSRCCRGRAKPVPSPRQGKPSVLHPCASAVCFSCTVPLPFLPPATTVSMPLARCKDMRQQCHLPDAGPNSPGPHIADQHAAGHQPPAAARPAASGSAAPQQLQRSPAAGIWRVCVSGAGRMDLTGGSRHGLGAGFLLEESIAVRAPLQ